MELTQEQRDLCATAAEAIITAFAWGSTPEGANYWEEVYMKLVDMGSEPAAPAKEEATAEVHQEVADLREELANLRCDLECLRIELTTLKGSKRTKR